MSIVIPRRWVPRLLLLLLLSHLAAGLRDGADDLLRGSGRDLQARAGGRYHPAR